MELVELCLKAGAFKHSFFIIIKLGYSAVVVLRYDVYSTYFTMLKAININQLMQWK